MNTGILGTRASWAADLNLLAQIVLLVVLIVGRVQAKKRQLVAHHTWMTAMVVANAVLIIAVMNPAFFRLLPSALSDPGSTQTIAIWAHASLGAAAELIGVYAVLSMRMDVPESWRIRNVKWFMRIAFLLWALALVVGIVLYWVQYV